MAEQLVTLFRSSSTSDPTSRPDVNRTPRRLRNPCTQGSTWLPIPLSRNSQRKALSSPPRPEPRLCAGPYPKKIASLVNRRLANLRDASAGALAPRDRVYASHRQCQAQDYNIISQTAGVAKNAPIPRLYRRMRMRRTVNFARIPDFLFLCTCAHVLMFARGHPAARPMRGMPRMVKRYNDVRGGPAMAQPAALVRLWQKRQRLPADLRSHEMQTPVLLCAPRPGAPPDN